MTMVNDKLFIQEQQKITRYLNALHPRVPKRDKLIKKAIEEIKLLQKFSFRGSNKFYFIFDQVKFKIIYASENITSTGYTQEYIYNMTMLQTLQKLYWKQISWISKVQKDGQAFRKIAKYTSPKNQETLYCGLKVKDRWGNLKTFLCKQKILAVNQNKEPILSFIAVEDISSIYKSDTAWCQISDYTDNIPTKRVFFYGGGITSNNLLSDREIEILKLILKKKESASISKKLNISVETVKKHRKNMIAKVGAKDMTALIFLCQHANII